MKIRIYLFLVATALEILGCSSHGAYAQQPSDRATAQIGIANHTGDFIYSASVDGAGGGSMSRWGAGMANICCTSIHMFGIPG